MGRKTVEGRRYPWGRRNAVYQRTIWTCRNVSTLFIKVVRGTARITIGENGEPRWWRVQESPFTEIPSIIAGCTAIGRCPERTTRRAATVAQPTGPGGMESGVIHCGILWKVFGWTVMSLFALREEIFGSRISSCYRTVEGWKAEKFIILFRDECTKYRGEVFGTEVMNLFLVESGQLFEKLFEKLKDIWGQRQRNLLCNFRVISKKGIICNFLGRYIWTGLLLELWNIFCKGC